MSEPKAHFARPYAVDRSQRADGMEAVEEEMRIELDAERLQLRLTGERPRFGRAPLCIAGRFSGDYRVVQPRGKQEQQDSQCEEQSREPGTQHRRARDGCRRG